MGNLDQAKEGGAGKRLFLKPDASVVFYVVEDYDNLYMVRRHTGGLQYQGRWHRYLCLDDETFGLDDEDCPACRDPRSQVQRTQTRLPLLVLMMDGSVRYAELNWYDIVRLNEMYEGVGSINERPIRYSRYGAGRDTQYGMKFENPDNYPRPVYSEEERDALKELIEREYFTPMAPAELREVLENAFLGGRPPMVEVGDDVIEYSSAARREGPIE